jgi:hypothetical protein
MKNIAKSENLDLSQIFWQNDNIYAENLHSFSLGKIYINLADERTLPARENIYHKKQKILGKISNLT